MGRHLKIGNVQYNIEAMRLITLEEALKVHSSNPVINSEDVKKAWKACNGFSIPNHLKDQLKGVKPNKEKERSEKKVEPKRSKKK